VFQGALANVAKHSKAKRVQIAVRRIKGSIIQMTIEDNGIGFITTKQRTKEMVGITAMQERIDKLGGQFRLKSRHGSSKDPRSGTRIEVAIPVTAVTAKVVA
jgi:signal transduction histidine kinase